MSVDMFLQIKGVTGETVDDVYMSRDGIDILAWSWGMTQSGTTHLGPGAGSGKVNISDLTLTKYVDKASAPLMKSCAKGTHFEKAVLTVRKAGTEGPVEYFKMLMKDLMVSSYTTGGSSDGLDRIQETVTLNFASYSIEYTPQDAKGIAGGKSSAGFDVAKNVEFTESIPQGKL